MSDETSARFRPFYCGSQGADWKCYNCDLCTKGYDDTARKWPCDIEQKIDEAYMQDGTVDADTARRMGMPKADEVFNWRCPEFIAAPPRPKPTPPITLRGINKPAPWIEEWLAQRQT